MTPKTNLHTHTSFTDGADTAETMVRAALERGFFSLGFSDHMPDGWWRIPTETVAEYRAEALRLKEKYFRQIEIAVGAERDFSIPLPHDGWDYLIDSVHVFRVGGESFPVDHSREDLLRTLTERFGGDGLRMAADYYGMVCRCIEERDGEIVGHLNLIEKFNDDGRFFDAEDPRYLSLAMEAVRLAAERDRIVEINTGAMSRGYRAEPYPSRAMLTELRRRGGRIAVTSDCHRAEWIDFGFDRAVQLARDCGFDSQWVWRDGALREAAL